jgi:2-oxoglutarate dehydrogenase E2 component (dihydrolipoamide succinyltransferase)
MGESIVEGTIVRWLKKVGDHVDRDEPLFEITTDKVEAEIPSPAEGILAEITAREGETVSVNTVVGTIQQRGEQAAPDKSHQSSKPNTQTVAPTPTAVASEARAAVDGPPVRPAGRETAGGAASRSTGNELRRQKSSPLVRRIAREHGVDITSLEGSGVGGRVTKQDILEHLGHGPGILESGPGGPPTAPVREPGTPSPQSPASGPAAQVQPLSPMRKKIAEHMVLSRRTAAHVHTVFNVDFSLIESIRREKKGEYERAGAKLTYMAFIAKAVSDTLRQHRVVNASLEGDNVVYKTDVNLGIAVALDSGLIVPVIHHADEKNLLGLSRAIADLAERARAKQLKPEEVHGGTFTVTNPGHFGAQFGMPIINQPQSAILGIGTIEKRPVVIGDGIAIRTMSYLTLGYDHRLIDGAAADQFMADVKKHLESFDPNEV